MEMNTIVEIDANLTFSKNRKIASSFRDQQLYDIFLLSCSLLITARDNSNKTPNFMDESQQPYIKYEMETHPPPPSLLSCLLYQIDIYMLLLDFFVLV